MTASELKLDLLQKIEALDKRQLNDIYGMLQNYFNSNETAEEWETLSDQQKEKIELGLRQADEGFTKPVAEVTSKLRKKYGLNG
jgi:hypothetical protein